MSLSDIYEDVSSDFENRAPTFIDFLDEYIDFSALIPDSSYRAFYSYTGRKRVYSLESFIRYFTLKIFLGIDKDSVILSLLFLCKELFDFCDFPKVPDAAKITRFKQSFHSHIKEFFEHLVDVIEPICRELNEKKSDYLLFDAAQQMFTKEEAVVKKAYALQQIKAVLKQWHIELTDEEIATYIEGVLKDIKTNFEL